MDRAEFLAIMRMWGAKGVSTGSLFLAGLNPDGSGVEFKIVLVEDHGPPPSYIHNDGTITQMVYVTTRFYDATVHDEVLFTSGGCVLMQHAAAVDYIHRRMTKRYWAWSTN